MEHLNAHQQYLDVLDEVINRAEDLKAGAETLNREAHALWCDRIAADARAMVYALPLDVLPETWSTDNKLRALVTRLQAQLASVDAVLTSIEPLPTPGSGGEDEFEEDEDEFDDEDEDTASE